MLQGGVQSAAVLRVRSKLIARFGCPSQLEAAAGCWPTQLCSMREP